jgi:hypothetical protein
MKKFYFLLLGLIFATQVWAQSPQRISYQAVIRNSSGGLVTSSVVGMKISILQGSVNGTSVYVETQTPAANANGLVSLEIGAGTVVNGNFSTIDWSSGPYFIKTETDPSGGAFYTITVTSQLLSVPYALYAEKAGNTTAGPPGIPGEVGKSAYQIWLDLGNTGTEAEFLSSLTGPQGAAGKNSLIITSNEPVGDNCVNGGVKIQVGLDVNSNGVLDDEEIDSSLTKFICNSLTDIVDPSSSIHGAVNVDQGDTLNWTVPNGVFTIQIIVNGSKGGDSGLTCRDSSCNWDNSRGNGGLFASATFNINVLPGQIFNLKVGNNGINGNNSTRLVIPGDPGTDGTLTKIDLNGVEIINISGGKGGVAGIGPCGSCAPLAGTNGANGVVSYNSGNGLLNLQKSVNQSFNNVNGAAKIRIEY